MVDSPTLLVKEQGLWLHADYRIMVHFSQYCIHAHENPRPVPRLPQNRPSIIILASDVSIHLDSVNDACFPVSQYLFAASLQKTATPCLERS